MHSGGSEEKDMKNHTLILVLAVAAMLAFASTAQARALDPSDLYRERPSAEQLQQYDPSSTTGLDCHIAIIGEDTECFVLDNLNQPLDDDDCDCVANADDNCQDDFNPDQEIDEFGRGLACTDSDGDGVMDSTDYRHPDGTDSLNDGIGDMCEDSDNDGWQDEEDNCPYDYNTPQGDMDDDGWGNACDNCPLVDNPSQLDTDLDEKGDACSNDDDGDGVLDAVDNCPVRNNPDQDDMDGDGIGDRCDNCMDTTNGDQLDSDNDGIGDVCESNPTAAINMPVSNFDDGGCTLGMASTGNPASLILLALALVPAIITRRKKR